MKHRRQYLAILFVLFLLFGACQHPVPDTPGVVATFDGGQITAEDIDREILYLPPAQRKPENQDFSEWFEKITRQLAVYRVVAKQARDQGLDQEPELVRLREEGRRQVLTTLFLEEHSPALSPVTEDELRAAFEEQVERFQRRGRRLTFHLFRRLKPQDDPSQIAKELENLRQQIIAGQSFAELAKKYSDSESRHQGGALGWLEKGKVTPDLEQVIFSLPVGIPSEPITTREGIHLFLVKEEVRAKVFTFEEMEPLLRNQLIAQRQAEALGEFVDQAPPEGSFIPTPQELQELLASGDAASTVLRIGTYHLRLKDLLHLQPAHQRFSGSGFLATQTLVESLARREVLYQHCLAEGFDRRPEAASILVDRVERELEKWFLRKRLIQEVEQDASRLEDYYAAHQNRFSSPLRLRLQKLAIPLSSNANKQMTVLENRKAPAEGSAQVFQELAGQFKGEVTNLNWVTLPELMRQQGKAAQLVLDLKPNEYSAPYRTRSHIEMIHLLEREEPVPLTLEKARPSVIDDYLLNHGQQLFEEFSRELLEGAHFRLNYSALENLQHSSYSP